MTFDDNKRFIDELEKYFEQPEATKLADARPDLHYQVGVTPEGVETPRCLTDPECHKLINEVRDDFFAPLSHCCDVFSNKRPSIVVFMCILDGSAK